MAAAWYAGWWQARQSGQPPLVSGWNSWSRSSRASPGQLARPDANDEHDPEGATIASGRQHVAALASRPAAASTGTR